MDRDQSRDTDLTFPQDGKDGRTGSSYARARAYLENIDRHLSDVDASIRVIHADLRDLRQQLAKLNSGNATHPDRAKNPQYASESAVPATPGHLTPVTKPENDAPDLSL